MDEEEAKRKLEEFAKNPKTPDNLEYSSGDKIEIEYRLLRLMYEVKKEE